MFFFKIKDKKTWNLIQNASTIGLHMVSATFVGMLMGYGLDAWIGVTKPWLTIVFLLLGIISGFKLVYEEAVKIQRAEEGSDDKDKDSGQSA